MTIDPEDLRDALLAVLARPAPGPREPKEIKDAVLDPLKMDFDWDALRLMVNAKILRDDLRGPRGSGITALARTVGVADTALGPFLHGDTRTPSVRTAMRLMAWVGYTDFAEFLVDHDD
jgi:hypothetical protein